MKKLLIILTLFALGCQSVPKKTSQYQMRPFQEITLSNGLPILLIPDKKLPYFQMTLLIYSGSSSDPATKLGLSHITAQLLDKGTKQRQATTIANSLEQFGSHFYATSGRDSIEVGGSGLSFYKDQLLKDFSEILLQPSFHKNEIKDMKEKILSQLIKTVDHPRAMADVALQSYLYETHPYSRRILGQKQDVQSITQKDIFKFYRKHYTPKNSMLAVVGDFDNNKIISKLEAHLGQWGGAKVLPVTYPHFPKISGLQIRLIDHPDVKQTRIGLAHKGIKRSNPDFLALRLANTILGRGFGSRLVEEIRVKRGLTYGIYSTFDSRKDFGPFFVSTFTRHEKVGETLQETLNTIKKFIENGVTSNELTLAKSLMKGGFPRALETAERFAQTLLTLRFHGIPETYLTNFYSEINRIDKSEVNQAIKKYFNAENMKVIVYGPKDQISEQVKSIGTVEVMSYKDFL